MILTSTPGTRMRNGLQHLDFELKPATRWPLVPLISLALNLNPRMHIIKNIKSKRLSSRRAAVPQTAEQ